MKACKHEGGRMEMKEKNSRLSMFEQQHCSPQQQSFHHSHADQELGGDRTGRILRAIVGHGRPLTAVDLDKESLLGCPDQPVSLTIVDTRLIRFDR